MGNTEQRENIMKKGQFKLGMKVKDKVINRPRVVIGITEFLVNDKPDSPTNFQVMVGGDMTKEGKYTEGRWYDENAIERLVVAH